METRKLYYEDSHQCAFTATVLSCVETDKGFEVILDATAFYPEGGGQDGDTGTLGGVRVLDTRERGEAVVHLCDGPLEAGASVAGCIDWDARFIRMQQHSGEHIVSGIIHRKYGFHNTGFHMSSDIITIDFDGVIPKKDLPRLEALANEAVWANLPVLCEVPSPEALKELFYRTKRELPWPVRLVEVPGYDRCACCGTHVKNTGEIGLIKLFSAIRFRNGTRMEMACGQRALELLNAAYQQNKLVSQECSAEITDTGAKVRELKKTLIHQKMRIGKLERQIFASIAAGYADKGHVLRFEEDLDGNALELLAKAIAAQCGGIAAVFTGSDESGWQFCAAAQQGDLKAFGRAMVKALNGKGGGPSTVQRGRVCASGAEIEAFFAQSGEALSSAYAAPSCAARFDFAKGDDFPGKLLSDLKQIK